MSANGGPEPKRRDKPVRKTSRIVFHGGEGIGAYQVVFLALSALRITCERFDALQHRCFAVYSGRLTAAGKS